MTGEGLQVYLKFGNAYKNRKRKGVVGLSHFGSNEFNAQGVDHQYIASAPSLSPSPRLSFESSFVEAAKYIVR